MKYDLSLTDRHHDELGVEWMQKGGACISVIEEYCASTVALTRDQLLRLAAHLLVGIAEEDGVVGDLTACSLEEAIAGLSEQIAAEMVKL